MENKDSKKLWLNIDKTISNQNFSLGRYTTQALSDDPISISFIASRYKFCSKMLASKDKILEVGCGDGFGSIIIQQFCKKLTCTDINKVQISDNQKRYIHLKKIDFKYHDFRNNPLKQKYDAVYLIDVIEHIFPKEEHKFLKNIFKSLNKDGICMIGTPNQTSQKFASKYSKLGHVNTKTYEDLSEMGKKYFKNYFIFGMNDEVIHTGYSKMCHYLWLIGSCIK